MGDLLRTGSTAPFVHVLALSLCLILSFPARAGGFAKPHPWQNAKPPADAPAEVIGFYSHGCIRGASRLSNPESGSAHAYRIMDHENQGRVYGHPDLIRFIQDYSAALKPQGRAIFVGDLAQARGGPMAAKGSGKVSGHRSHQNGLDVDLWFTSAEQDGQFLSSRTAPGFQVHVVNEDAAAEKSLLRQIGRLQPRSPFPSLDPVLDRKKMEDQIPKLQTAAADRAVERIFVNCWIKAYLCRVWQGSDQDWLHKIRPWPGHKEHLHVRLKCPADSGRCVPDDPVDEGIGCSEKEMATWLPECVNPGPSKPRQAPPKECDEVFAEAPAPARKVQSLPQKDVRRPGKSRRNSS